MLIAERLSEISISSEAMAMLRELAGAPLMPLRSCDRAAQIDAITVPFKLNPGAALGASACSSQGITVRICLTRRRTRGSLSFNPFAPRTQRHGCLPSSPVDYARS
jgi:hypothetical protein